MHYGCHFGHYNGVNNIYIHLIIILDTYRYRYIILGGVPSATICYFFHSDAGENNYTTNNNDDDGRTFGLLYTYLFPLSIRRAIQRHEETESNRLLSANRG